MAKGRRTSADPILQEDLRRFGGRLKQLRHEMDLSQPELAELLDVQRTTVGSWESGTTAPDIKLLLKLKAVTADRIAVDLGTLLGEERPDSGETPLSFAIGLLKTIERVGLRGIYLNRSEALKAFSPFLEEERKSISIVSSSFLGVRTVADAQISGLLKEKAAQVDDFRILLTHPEMSRLREEQEDRREGAIEREIVETLDTLKESWGVDDSQIRLYRGAPTIFLLATPKRLLANPYTYGTEAYQTACFEVAPVPGQRETVYSQYYERHFRDPWESTSAVKLEDYAGKSR